MCRTAWQECHQFPDPTLATLCPIPDKVVVSLIMVAIAIPTRNIIGRLFELGNRPVGLDGSLWLKCSGFVKLVTGKVSWCGVPAKAKQN